ncbi:MAG: hypothetical protein EXR31_08315 [Betaproteobacteria bacterium]|nr:hypothetical protein [Betaproteobacteria bacterium]
MKIAAALASAALAAGCANPMQSMPPDWPAVESAAACPALAGAYDNVGATSGRFGAALSWFVMPSQDAATRKHLESAYRIEIAGDPATELDVSAWRRNAFVARRTLKPGTDYNCEEGALVLSLPGEGASRLRGAALMRATDRSIVARTNSVEMGLKYYVLPYAIPSRVWARFEPQAVR